MRNRNHISLSLCLLFGVFLLTAKPLTAADEEVSLTASVDRDQVSLQEYVVLKIEVEGSREEPELPDMPAFKIQSRGSSSHIQIINGAVSSKIEFTYTLFPQKTGTFTLGPFSITHRGKKITSNPITVTVTQAQASSDREPSEDIYVTAQVDNERPYLYQQIVCTFRFFRCVNVTQANLTDQPSFEGFLVEDIGKASEYQKNINGRQYVVTEIKKALFPIKTGVLEIGPFTLQCDMIVQKSRRRGFFQDPFFNDPFFGFTETVPRTFRTTPIQVMVQQLPADARPPDFKNLVGSYTISATISNPTVSVGESATLTLTIAGTGNLKYLTGIDLPPLENVKIYDDKPVYEQTITQGKIGGTMTLKKALVPSASGEITIPPISVSFFDPADARYKQATTQPLQLAVRPGTSTAPVPVAQAVPQSSSTKQEVAVLGRDIMPIRTTPKSLDPGLPNLRPMHVAVFGLAPILLFTSFVFIQRARKKTISDIALMRARTAYKRFKKSAKQLKHMATDDSSLFYQQASKAFRDFIGDKLGITGAALTPHELSDILYRSGIDEPLVQEAARLLDFLDAGRYGVVTHTVRERQDASAALMRLVRDIDRLLKTKPSPIQHNKS
ncbi:MAG: BatD family protein [Desulfobacterota bacterium]|nr:BatD family protein [Thermodesulfobacteriota bacterium]